jgi:hypothetical protein
MTWYDIGGTDYCTSTSPKREQEVQPSLPYCTEMSESRGSSFGIHELLVNYAHAINSFPPSIPKCKCNVQLQSTRTTRQKTLKLARVSSPCQKLLSVPISRRLAENACNPMFVSFISECWCQTSTLHDEISQAETKSHDRHVNRTVFAAWLQCLAAT